MFYYIYVFFLPENTANSGLNHGSFSKSYLWSIQSLET